jgi:hypothetical protein
MYYLPCKIVDDRAAVRRRPGMYRRELLQRDYFQPRIIVDDRMAVRRRSGM